MCHSVALSPIPTGTEDWDFKEPLKVAVLAGTDPLILNIRLLLESVEEYLSVNTLGPPLKLEFTPDDQIASEFGSLIGITTRTCINSRAKYDDCPNRNDEHFKVHENSLVLEFAQPVLLLFPTITLKAS